MHSFRHFQLPFGLSLTLPRTLCALRDPSNSGVVKSPSTIRLIPRYGGHGLFGSRKSRVHERAQITMESHLWWWYAKPAAIRGFLRDEYSFVSLKACHSRAARPWSSRPLATGPPKPLEHLQCTIWQLLPRSQPAIPGSFPSSPYAYRLTTIAQYIPIMYLLRFQAMTLRQKGLSVVTSLADTL